MKIRLRILFVVQLLFSIAVRAQSPLDTLAMRAIMVNQLFPQEKVYLHFDNTSYYLGETMWFKAYVLGTSGHTLRPQSKVLYVELVAPEGYVVETKKYKLDDKGCCNGDFELKASILSGYYTVRAYTRYMLNWGDEAIFARTFPIYDAVSGGHYEIKDMLDRKRSSLDVKEKQRENAEKYCLTFYPEGGHLIDGIPCVVAYELLQNNGAPLTDSIAICADGDPLLYTVPEHNGKGSFVFTPSSSIQYSAEIRYQEDSKIGRQKVRTIKFTLPLVEKFGVGVSVKEQADSFILQIQNNLDSELPLGCTIFNKGRMQMYETFSSDVTCKTIVVHSDSLPEGINRLVVFANHETPLAERQFFVRHERLHSDDLQHVPLRVQTSEVKSLRGSEQDANKKMLIRIEREDGSPIPHDASLSLSLTDSEFRDTIGLGNNFYTHLLLGSELKGYIPHASRYFSPNNANRSRELDLVMLTHGWTSYDWTALSNKYVDLQHPIETGLLINGELLEFSYKTSDRRIVNEKSLVSYAPIPFRVMTLSKQKGGLLQDYEFTTDADGRFWLRMDDFYGDCIVSLSPGQKPNKSTRAIVLLDKSFSPKPLTEQYLRIGLSKDAQTEMLKVGNLDYLLPDAEITNDSRKNRYHLPPLSEVHYNYLNEWERNYDTYWKMKKTLLDGGNGSDIKEDSVPTVWYGPWFNAYIYGFRNQDGDMTIADEGVAPYKVVGSTFLRNFVGCYWLHYMAVDENNYPDSIVMDEDYLAQMDFLNPFKFKEFFISHDYAVRQQITSDISHWVNKYNMIIGKYRKYRGDNIDVYSLDGNPGYLHGFYVNQILLPTSLAADWSVGEKFMGKAQGSARWILQKNKSKYSSSGVLPISAPNYVACMVPYTASERDSLYLPNYDNGINERFTNLQGYSRSKSFYSPNYMGKELLYDESEYHRTLLWDTEIMPDSTGTITLSLSNLPSTKEVAVSIEGMCNRQIFSNESLGGQRQLYTETENRNKDLQIWRNVVDTILPSPSELIAMHKENIEGVRKLQEQQLDDAVMLFKKSAMKLYPPAIANLGICYHRGWGVEKDVDMAYKYYLLAAERGDASACHNLGGCYLNGVPIPSNDSLAFVWYKRAADKGYLQSQVVLGKFYEEGMGSVEKSDSLALQYYLLASEKYPEASLAAAMILVSHDSISGLSKKELRQSQTAKLLLSAAEGGQLKAQRYLADCYREGYYVKKSKKRMASCLTVCAEQGDEQSLLRLARCYERGIGVKEDRKKSYSYYQQLAQKGNEYAQKKVREYEYYGDFLFDRTKLEDL